ncbi:hypothetical protein ANCDUO_08836 [Ancylostoma duodenale]|uniref:Uncharacterized protein n=1 Tax=Ancylostoma duodenale TaxID=51022 RepID=A0A0C2GUU1_9BILA|nr:hypothetical protein ANCDUO_08836 [Ancylostoma duodenale]
MQYPDEMVLQFNARGVETILSMEQVWLQLPRKSQNPTPARAVRSPTESEFSMVSELSWDRASIVTDSRQGSRYRNN